MPDLTTPRPCIVGYNNPRSADPEQALYPHDRGAAGHRLWRMVHAACGVPVAAWLAGTRRVNLVDDTVLPSGHQELASDAAAVLVDMVAAPCYVLLGADVARAFGHRAEPFVWDGSCIMIPHPSGRNHFYNDTANRLATGVLLSEILEHCHATD